ncbi:hypothetical protein GQ42DRAFT_155154 [Ramicandelaber brevisporus]|nr:hypothetical protein GQ42DRAFT_155154 [Ramicandelaber brevisporus]
MTEFGDDPAYALEYLRHLVSIHDVIKARAAFEEALTRVPVAKQRSLWQLMASYERTYGDFGAIQRIEQRFIEAFPGEDLSRRLLNKFTTAGLTSYIGPRELGIPCVAESAVSGRRSLLDDGGSGSGGGGGDEQDDGTGLQSILLNDDEERGRMGGKKRPGVILTTGYWAKELNKAELLAPVSRGRGLKPDASKWRPFRPSAEDTRSAYRFGAVSAQEAANAQRLPPVPAAGPPPPLLDPNRPTGFARDPLSAIVAALPAQPYAFNGPPLNIEEMLSIISREVPNRTLQFIMEGAHPERADAGLGHGRRQLIEPERRDEVDARHGSTRRFPFLETDKHLGKRRKNLFRLRIVNV